MVKRDKYIYIYCEVKEPLLTFIQVHLTRKTRHYSSKRDFEIAKLGLPKSDMAVVGGENIFVPSLCQLIEYKLPENRDLTSK